MEKFTRVTSVAALLPLLNVDTDLILPAQYMKGLTRNNLGKHLFQSIRYDEKGGERPEFILNHPPCRDTRILIAGRNFGCGSSREHAVWAIKDFGISCIIAPSFGAIFAANSRNNGLLLITLPDTICRDLTDVILKSDYAPMTVDLASTKISFSTGEVIPFAIDPNDRHVLLEGLDDITRSLQHEAAIERFENAA